VARRFENEMTGPLVSVGWLSDRLGRDDLRIADCRWYLGEPERGIAAFRSAHLPGAVYVSLDDDLSSPTGPGRHPLPRPEDYATHLAGMGFGDDHLIVVYDDRSGAVAARMWWMLRSIGHRSVAVLDGGLDAWRAAKLPVTGELAGHRDARLTIRSRPRTIDAATLEARLGEVTLIDARDGDRYRGEREPIDAVAGHIPTAISLPLTGNLRGDGTFEQAAALLRRYRAAGVAQGIETVVYCGSGVTACHDILAMELAGLSDAILYPGSWSDWSSSGRTVATGAATE